MTGSLRRRHLLSAGSATGVGSLPHTDATEAAGLVADTMGSLPFAPQLPRRNPREGMLAQWLRALPEVEVAPDGTVALRDGPVPEAGDPEPVLDDEAHGGLLALLDRLQGSTPRVLKLQLTGPVTLGVALVDAGMEPGRAFARADELATAWAEVLVAAAERAVPAANPLVFLDEPSLVLWNGDDVPLAREEAVDLLSGVLAAVGAVTGVHVCGEGDRRMALEAGPEVIGFEVRPSVLDDGVALSRFLDAGGWVAWGALPTDRPVGERVDHWWNGLVSLWCDLTRGGCDPVTLRTQAVITPACGLADHTEGQARRILSHCVEIGERVREQAVATRLSVGA